MELMRQPQQLRIVEAQEQKEVPKLRDFAPDTVTKYDRANNKKGSSIRSKELIVENHLIPILGDKRLDAIDDQTIQELKGKLSAKGLAPKTVNNVLAVLSKVLRLAVRWKRIAAMPCTIEFLKIDNRKVVFFEFDEYMRIVQVAKSMGPSFLAMVLLGGRRASRGRDHCPRVAERRLQARAAHHRAADVAARDRLAEVRARRERADDGCALRCAAGSSQAGAQGSLRVRDGSCRPAAFVSIDLASFQPRAARGQARPGVACTSSGTLSVATSR
jgi:hypothetical protein